MQSPKEKAHLLVEALPFIKEFRGSTIVVKIGGASLDDRELRERFAEDLILLSWVGIRVIVVHGGGTQISRMLDRLGIEPVFVEGQRVTDEATLEVVEMVLGGHLNQELVRVIQQAGGRSVGITGKDGGLVTAIKLQKTPDLGLVGEVSAVDTTLLETLLPEFIPVVAPLAVTSAGQTLNVNADPFAASLAIALGAKKFVLLSDVAGVLDSGGELLTTLGVNRAETLIAEGTIAGGMIPKVGHALRALEGGVEKVHIIDGRLEHALLLEVCTKDGVGTQLLPATEKETSSK